MPDRNAMTVLQDADPTRPYIGMGANQRRQIKTAQQLRKGPEYRGTAMDDYYSGIFGGDTGGSVFDPERGKRVQANDIGQQAGIFLDVIDPLKVALAGAVKGVPALAKVIGRKKPGVGPVKIGSEVADDALATAVRRNADAVPAGVEGGNVLDALARTVPQEDLLHGGTMVSPVDLKSKKPATGTTRGLGKVQAFELPDDPTAGQKNFDAFIGSLGRDPHTKVGMAAQKRLIDVDNPTPKQVVQAQEDALSELRWRFEKPALLKEYGPLNQARYDAPPQRRLSNPPEVVRQNQQHALDFLKQPTEPWKPREYAFERKSIRDALEGWPGVQQTRFSRYTPTERTDLSHVDALFNDPTNVDLIKRQIMRGLPLGGETFYASLWPVMQEALSRGIPPEKVIRWIQGTSPASARNSIMNEQAVGNALLAAHLRGQPLNAQTAAAVKRRFIDQYGASLPMFEGHYRGIDRALRNPQDFRAQMLAPQDKLADALEYKIYNYGNQKTGDFAHSYVGDVHEAGGLSYGTPYRPYFTEQGGFPVGEYGRMEDNMLGISRDLGLPGGMAQAGRWFGGGELTGLASPRGDALDILEKQVAYTLKQTGQDYSPRAVRDYVMQLIQSGGDLLPWWSKNSQMPDVRF